MISRGPFQSQWLCGSKMRNANDLVGISDATLPAPKFSMYASTRSYERKQIPKSKFKTVYLTSHIVRLTLKVGDMLFSDLTAANLP